MHGSKLYRVKGLKVTEGGWEACVFAIEISLALGLFSWMISCIAYCVDAHALRIAIRFLKIFCRISKHVFCFCQLR